MSSELTRKTYQAIIRGWDEQAKTVTALITTGSLDRDEEIILPESLERLMPIYEQNPILLWGHEQRGGPESALGTMVKKKRVAEGWEFTFRYAVEKNPKAAMVFDLIVAGVLKAYSIGFIPRAWVTPRSPAEAINALPEYARELVQRGICRTCYTEVELLETSNVLIGSNRDAVLRHMVKGLVAPEILEEVLSGMEDQKTPAAAPVEKTTPTPPAPEVKVEPPAPAPTEKSAPAESAAAAAAETKKKMHPVTADICARLRTVADNLEGYLDPDYWWKTTEECNAPPRTSIVTGAKSILQSVTQQLEQLEQESMAAADPGSSAPPPVVAAASPPAPATKAPAAEPAPPADEEQAVLAEASAIAFKAVEAALREKGIDPASVPEEKMAEFVASMLTE